MKRVLLSLLLLTALVASSCATKFSSPDINKIIHSIVLIQKTTYDDKDEEQTQTCSGFVINSSKGLALTATHCVGPDMYVDGVPSYILKINESLALIQTDPMARPPLKLADEAVKVGEPVWSFGFGFGSMTVLTRNIAALDDQDIVIGGALYPGMSGGPTVNRDGKVVGLNQASSYVVGLGCGVDEIKDFLK